MSAQKKNQNSMVPIIFTLGIISWVFFVTDRLTKPAQEQLPIEQPTRVHNVSPVQNKNSWKNSLLDFVDSFDKKKKQKAVRQKQDGSLSVIDEKDSSFIQQYSPVKEKNNKQFSEQPQEKHIPSENLSTQNTADVHIYLFQYDGNEYPELVAVKRAVNSFQNEQDFFTKTFRYVIAGPTNTESSFVDSFPVKPILHNVQKTDDTLLLNFNEDFGRGVSFPMLQLQLEQLLKTATAFQGIHNISIAINGKPQSYVGGDGLAIPDIINQETLTSSRH